MEDSGHPSPGLQGFMATVCYPGLPGSACMLGSGAFYAVRSETAAKMTVASGCHMPGNELAGRGVRSTRQTEFSWGTLKVGWFRGPKQVQVWV